jgi:hypothetical protein
MAHSHRNGGNMPLYYFSTTSSERQDDRDDPIELPNDAAAWAQVTASFGEQLKEISGALTPNEEWRVDVKDEAHELIFSLKLMPKSYR